MESLECPKCHAQAMPLWKKMCLGPARGVTCQNCGTRVSVPYVSGFAAIPFLIAIVAAQIVGSVFLAAALLAVGILVTAWIYYKFVPLIVK